MKSLLKKIIGERAFNFLVLRYRYIRNFINLLKNFNNDMWMFFKHSNVFSDKAFEKIEAKIILNYHGIEKGFVHTKIRPRFAVKRVKNLIEELDIVEKKYCPSSQTLIAQKVLMDYYEYHQNLSISIKDYFPEKVYNNYKQKTKINDKAFIETTKSEYFSNINKSFEQFSNSRKSIRSFTQEKISTEIIEEVVQLAANAPSVCNRQPSKTYFINNKELANQILDIQGGLTGFQGEINQILMVTVDRNYFYTIGERNQFYIDGGIYLLNLMYALHHKKIGCCPANWGKTYDVDKKAQDILKLKKSEKIICVLAIGYIQDEVRYTLSKRRPLKEVLRVLD